MKPQPSNQHTTLPRISMSRTAHYVTQQSIWDVQRLGPLTDRKIAKYQKQGRYTDGQHFLSDAERREQQDKKQKKQQTKEQRQKKFAIKNALAQLLAL